MITDYNVRATLYHKTNSITSPQNSNASGTTFDSGKRVKISQSLTIQDPGRSFVVFLDFVPEDYKEMAFVLLKINLNWFWLIWLKFSSRTVDFQPFADVRNVPQLPLVAIIRFFFLPVEGSKNGVHWRNFVLARDSYES